jgi:hypothetical protein
MAFDSSKEARPAWRTPQVEELGNLRDFVRSGVANGKSILTTDGDSMAGNESMEQMS